MSLYITAGNRRAVGPDRMRVACRWGPAISLPLALPCLLISLVMAWWCPPVTVSQRRSESLGGILVKHRSALIRLFSVSMLRSWANVGLATFLPLLLVERGQAPRTARRRCACCCSSGGSAG